jgi:hypothetical protein
VFTSLMALSEEFWHRECLGLAAHMRFSKSNGIVTPRSASAAHPRIVETSATLILFDDAA